MRVLVTGSSGFIGRHVLAELRSRGHVPVSFDHLGRGDGEVYLGDVRDEVAVTEAMAHVHGWVHLAGILGTQETIANPRPSVLTNVVGGLNMLEAAAQYQLPGVYIAVGNHWMQNTYSITKTTVERFCAMFNIERGTRVNVVRCVNAYGPWQQAAVPFAAGKVRKIAPAFVCRALSGLPIEVYGDGEQVSDMLYVTDLANAVVEALELAARSVVAARPIEIGPVVHSTVNSVAELVRQEAAGLTGTLVPIRHLPMRPGELPGAVVTADTTTLTFLGVDPTGFVSLEKGMKTTVEWFQTHKGVTWSTPDESTTC